MISLTGVSISNKVHTDLPHILPSIYHIVHYISIFLEMNGNQSALKATVLCIGDPVLDIIACESPQGLLERFGYSAGGSDIIDEDELEKCLKEIEIVARYGTC